MSAVTSLDKGSRRTLSAAGRKNGSNRRSTRISRISARLIPLSRKLPVSGGGKPKPGPGLERETIDVLAAARAS
jgi:hypothetical protein